MLFSSLPILSFSDPLLLLALMPSFPPFFLSFSGVYLRSCSFKSYFSIADWILSQALPRAVKEEEEED